MTTTPANQLSHFREAVQLLGGERSASRAIGVSERTMRRILFGEARLHAGFLRDIAAALLTHAQACRKLEMRLSPMFQANLTAEQQTDTPDRRRYDMRDDGGRIFDAMQEAVAVARAAGRTPRRWQIDDAAAEALYKDPRIEFGASPIHTINGRELLGIPIALGKRRDGKDGPTFELIVDEV